MYLGGEGPAVVGLGGDRPQHAQRRQTRGQEHCQAPAGGLLQLATLNLFLLFLRADIWKSRPPPPCPGPRPPMFMHADGAIRDLLLVACGQGAARVRVDEGRRQRDRVVPTPPSPR